MGSSAKDGDTVAVWEGHCARPQPRSPKRPVNAVLRQKRSIPCQSGRRVLPPGIREASQGQSVPRSCQKKGSNSPGSFGSFSTSAMCVHQHSYNLKIGEIHAHVLPLGLGADVRSTDVLLSGRKRNTLTDLITEAQ